MASSGRKSARKTFEGLKKFLSTPPLLSKPREGEELFLYLAASLEAVSSVLVRINPDGMQKHVYYTSKVSMMWRLGTPRLKRLSLH